MPTMNHIIAHAFPLRCIRVLYSVLVYIEYIPRGLLMLFIEGRKAETVTLQQYSDALSHLFYTLMYEINIFC